MRFSAALPLLLALQLPCAAIGALAPLAPEAMAARASHIVVGQVTQIDAQDDRSVPGQVMTIYTATVSVEQVEQGVNLAPAQTIRVRYWRRSWLPGSTPAIGNDGYHTLPAVGRAFRFYLQPPNADVFGIVFPSGVVPLP